MRFKPVSDTPTLKEQGFYHTPAWRKLRAAALMRDHHQCRECLRHNRITLAREVHHVKPLEIFPALALDINNLECLCHDCHERTKDRSAQNKTPVYIPPGVRVIKP